MKISMQQIVLLAVAGSAALMFGSFSPFRIQNGEPDSSARVVEVRQPGDLRQVLAHAQSPVLVEFFSDG